MNEDLKCIMQMCLTGFLIPVVITAFSAFCFTIFMLVSSIFGDPIVWSTLLFAVKFGLSAGIIGAIGLPLLVFIISNF